MLGGCVNEVEFLTEDFQDETMVQPLPEYTSEETTEDTNQKIEKIDIKRDDTQSEIIYSFKKLVMPDDTAMYSYFIYDNYYFYSYKSVTDVENEEDNDMILCKTNIDTGESEIIYRASGNSNFVGIQCNGQYLIWEEYSDNGYAMNIIDLENNNEEVSVLDINPSFEDFILTEDYLFWLDHEKNSTNYYVYRYDFKTKDTVKLIQTTSRVSFNIEVSQKIISVLEPQKNVVNIRGYNFDGKFLYNYDIAESVIKGSCNSYGVAWRNSDKEVCFYDAKTDKIYSLGTAISYVLIEDCVIINDDKSGVYCYNVGNDVQKYIIRHNENSLSGMRVDVNGDIHGKWITPMSSMMWQENEFVLLKVSNSIKLN